MSATASEPESHRADALPSTGASGFLLALSGSPLVLLGPLSLANLGPLPRLAFAIAAIVLLVFGALLLSTRPRTARTLTALPVAGVSLALLPTWTSRPSATLVALLLLLLGGRMLFANSPGRLSAIAARFEGGTGHLRGAVFGALLSWVVWIVNGAPHATPLVGAVLWASSVALLFGAMRASKRLRSQPVRSGLILLLHGVTAAAVFFLWGRSFWVVTLPVALATTTGVSLRRPQSVLMGQETWWEPLLGHPERLLVGTFAALSLIGGLALSLPIAARGAIPLAGIDAFFTSVSAVCVTGLITVDTPIALSVFGQSVVLLLIQIGGLGIMTFSTAILWAVGGRMSLRHEGAVASLISTHDRGRLFDTARKIVLLTLVAESLGALILATLFVQAGESLGLALWRGLFTSISAFCNAGFALQSDSLIPYRETPLVLHTVGVLIILGGLSPLAVFALAPLVRRSVVPVLAQAKLALAAALVLLVTGFILILALEWNASLSDLSVVDKIHNAWFQSVTLRTAGFNSVDLTLIHPATLIVTLVWMFIGGSPGGTAGGVKTTTAASFSFL